MSAGTGELQALRDLVAEYQEHEKMLILTIASLTAPNPGLKVFRQARAQLRVIRGGRP